MRNLLKVVAISAVSVALVACHSAQTPNGTVAGEAPDSAQAYALNHKAGLNGADVNGGGANAVYHVNSLHAPSNQVYYFGFNQSNMSSADIHAATVQANYLVTHRSAQVRLEGNTDDRGSREYNVALGWRRAQAVANVLKQQGVSSRQIKMVSYGKEHPVVNGENEAAYRLNRRVELIYVQR
jgi:peptidoglycan-associated lipoprotein